MGVEHPILEVVGVIRWWLTRQPGDEKTGDNTGDGGNNRPGNRPGPAGSMSNAAGGIRNKVRRTPDERKAVPSRKPAGDARQPPDPQMITKIAGALRDMPALSLGRQPDELDLTRIVLASFLRQGYSVPGPKSKKWPRGWPANDQNGDKPKKQGNSTAIVEKDGRLTAIRSYDRSGGGRVERREVDEFARLCARHGIGKAVIATDGTFDGKRGKSARTVDNVAEPELWDWIKIMKKLREHHLDRWLAAAGVRI